MELPPPVRYEGRVLRKHSKLEESGLKLARTAVSKMVMAVEIDRKMDEDMPWALIEVTQPMEKHLGATVKHSDEKGSWSWMGQLNINDEYLTGKMLTRPRAGVIVFECSEWELYFFPQDISVLLM